MIHRLHKRSAPGWTKEFATEDGMLDELYSHICSHCLDGTWVSAMGDIIQEDVPDHTSVSDLLSTPCGCEFEVETR